MISKVSDRCGTLVSGLNNGLVAVSSAVRLVDFPRNVREFALITRTFTSDTMRTYSIGPMGSFIGTPMRSSRSRSMIAFVRFSEKLSSSLASVGSISTCLDWWEDLSSGGTGSTPPPLACGVVDYRSLSRIIMASYCEEFSCYQRRMDEWMGEEKEELSPFPYLFLVYFLLGIVVL